MDIHGNSGANTCYKHTRLFGRVHSLVTQTNHFGVSGDHNDGADRIYCDSSFEFLTYHSRRRYWAYRGCDG